MWRFPAGRVAGIWGREALPALAGCRASSQLTNPELESKSRIEKLEEDLKAMQEQKNVATLDEFRQEIRPFAKDFFLGKFNPMLMSYPDVLPNDRYFDLKAKCKHVKTFLASKKDLIDRIDAESHISQDITLPLQSMGVLGVTDPVAYGGQGLSLTELCRLLEEFGVNLSLSQHVSARNSFFASAIMTLGTPLAKEKYLAKLGNGEWSGAVCFGSEQSGVDPSMGNSVAIPERDMGHFRLKGSKTWVSNADQADFFLVFSKVLDSFNIAADGNDGIAPVITCFIVDRNSPGVEVGPPYDTKVGQKGVSVCTVNFDNVIVNEDNVLGDVNNGYTVLSSFMMPQRTMVGAQVSGLLRKVLDETLKHAQSRRAYNRDLIEFDLVKKNLAEMAIYLYTLEAMTYMTSGLSDVQKDVDITTEASMTKLFAVETVEVFRLNCLAILGHRMYVDDEPFNQIFQDLLGLNLWEGNTSMTRVVIGLQGGIHVGIAKAEDVKQWRNPISHPAAILRKSYDFYHIAKDNPRLTLRIEDSVHPSLRGASHNLERSIHKLRYGVERCMIHHGLNVQMREVDLARMGTMGTYSFAMASALARANRCFCQGHAHGEHGVEMANSIAALLYPHVLKVSKELEVGFMEKEDVLLYRIANYLATKGCYSAVHPITKNIF